MKISYVIWFQSCNSICVSCLCYFPIIMNFLRIDLFDKLENCVFAFFFAVFEPAACMPFILIVDCLLFDYLFALLKGFSEFRCSFCSFCYFCFNLMSVASMVKLSLNVKGPGLTLYLETKCLCFRFLILTSIVF